MSNESLPLIDAAVRPFHDNAEQAMAARQVLGELAAGKTGAAEALARWAAVDARPRRRWWRAAPYALLALASVAVLGDTARIAMRYEDTIPIWGGSLFVDVFHNSGVPSEEEIASKLAPEDTLLLFGDLTKGSRTERMKALWDSEPENAGWFAVYANEYLAETHAHPPDFLATARRLDPDNAWFTCVAAGVRAKDAVKKRKRSKAEIAANVPPEWDVVNRVALEEALALLRESRGQPEMESYWSEVGRARAKLLPHGTPAEVTAALSYSFGVSNADILSLPGLAEALAAKAWLCGKEDDPTAFQELAKDTDALLRKLTDAQVDSFLDELMNQAIAYGYFENAAPAARKLGLPELTATLEPVRAEMIRVKAAVQARNSRGDDRMLYDRGGSLAAIVNALLTGWIQDPPRLTEDEVKPGRLMDHETLAWAATQWVWAALVVAMAVAGLARFRSPRMMRRLAARCEELVLARDRAMVLGLGVALPAAYFLAVTRLTALGGWGLAMEVSNLAYVPYIDHPPLGFAQRMGLAGLAISSAAAVACWRLGCRTRPFALVTGISRSLLVPVACWAAFLPVSGWAVVHHSPPAAVAAWVLAGIGMGWVVPVGWALFAGGLRAQLRHGAVARLLVPAYGCAALLAICAAPLHKAAAFRWSAADTLVRMDRDHPADTVFGHRAALQEREELRVMLGYGRK